MKLGRLSIQLVAGLVLVGSGAYFFIYLYRWEWNRATVCGAIFIAAEVALALNRITSRLSKIEERAAAVERRHRISSHLRNADQPTRSFAWLKLDGSRTSVFVPILMGAGLVLSGLAWVVEKLGRATAGQTADESVAALLARLGPPPGGFLDDTADPLRLLRGPQGARR